MVNIEKGTDSGTSLRLRGMGMARTDNPDLRGDLFVKVVINVPKKLSKHEIELFEKLRDLRK
jgi:DnaJ-class molecular chaperone